MRVALLNPCYWPEVRRGAERMVRELAVGLTAGGHAVRLITSHGGRPRRDQEDGVDVLRLWRPPDLPLRGVGLDGFLTHVPFSYVALRAGRDDVANAFSPQEAIAAGRAARRRGVASVLSYMGVPTGQFLRERRARLSLTARACRSVDTVVALSQAAADAFWRELDVRAPVIHPGVDTSWFKPGGERAESPTIFCNASLELPYKRVDLLIRALPLVRRARPDARLILLRPRDEILLRTIERQCQWVEFLQPAPGTDDHALREAYRRAWVSALPASGEAFGLVLAESLACGTPVVGTDSGGIPEVIDRPGIGRLFEGDERNLARMLVEALDLSQAPGVNEACRARATELSSERTTEAYESLYHRLLSAGGTSSTS